MDFVEKDLGTEMEVSKVSVIKDASKNQFSSELNRWMAVKEKYNSTNLRSSSHEYIGDDWKELSIGNSGFDSLSIIINENDSQTESNDMLAYFMIDGYIEGEFLIREYATTDGRALEFKNKLFEDKSFAVVFKDNGDIEVANSATIRGGWANFIEDLNTSGDLIAGCLNDAYSKHGWKSVAITAGSIFSRYVGLSVVGACVARNLGRSSYKGVNPIF